MSDFQKIKTIIEERNKIPVLEAIKVNSEVYAILRDLFLIPNEKIESDLEKLKNQVRIIDRVKVILDESAEYPFTPVFNQQQAKEG